MKPRSAVTLSPGLIHALLWVYFTPEKFPAKAPEANLAELQSIKLIERADDRESGWRTTSRGNAYVDMLCCTPLPEQRWTDPRETT